MIKVSANSAESKKVIFLFICLVCFVVNYIFCLVFFEVEAGEGMHKKSMDNVLIHILRL